MKEVFDYCKLTQSRVLGVLWLCGDTKYGLQKIWSMVTRCTMVLAANFCVEARYIGE